MHLTLIKIIYTLLKPLNFTGNMFAGVVLKAK
jgi:hypothetical protein